MISAERLLPTLLETTLAGTAAVLLVLVLRRPLRAMFGARLAYAAWATVPLALLAVLLPARRLSPPMQATVADLPGAVIASAAPWRVMLEAVPVAWAAGAIGLGLLFAFQQRRFVRRLGDLRRHGDCLLSTRSEGLPATMGWWNPRVVLPADFETGYSASQRELMLLHERTHIARGDQHANLAAAALRCLFWFNPLLHYAAGCFRHDQELACDASVLARHPRARRDYGEALVQVQFTGRQAPLACQFGFGHPLKERIAMLATPCPSRRRRLGGAVLVSLVAIGSGFAAWAAQPAQVPPPVAPPAPPVPPAPPEAPPAPQAPPKYPAYAAEHKLSGRVVLLVDVAADGSVSHATIERSEPEGVFDDVALAAVMKWRFNPSTRDGQAVPGRVRVPIEFRGDGKAPQP